MDYDLSSSPDVNNGQLKRIPSSDLLPSCIAEFPDAVEWSYSMRREMQEIVKGLFLGPYSVAVRSKVSKLLSLLNIDFQNNDLFSSVQLPGRAWSHSHCLCPAES